MEVKPMNFQTFLTIHQESLKNHLINFQELSSCLIISSTYQNCTFNECDFTGTIFSRVKFQNCTFKNCKFQFTHFKECSFENCELIGCSWMGCSLRENLFIDTALDPVASSLLEANPNSFELTLATNHLAIEVTKELTASFAA
jgi:uncharacterized protein YjbI with pentapeptide repeats